MDASDEEKSCVIKNGKSIIGTIGAYQEKFGGTEKEIMNMSYVYFIIKMLDVPSPDYSNKKKDTGKKKREKQKLGFGTPIKDLPKSIKNEIRN